uniref:Uncharacterized protein n=1 Tax=Acrobeloides nanus TaxID=290746 RepID=A0A914E223_9BILA
MREKDVSYAAETISARAFVGLNALIDSWGADEETVGITSSGITILVVAGVVITIVKSFLEIVELGLTTPRTRSGPKTFA